MPNPERMKQTRLQDLDLKAKSILEAWARRTTDASEGYGPQQQKEAGSFNSGDDYRFTQSYYRDTTHQEQKGGSAETSNYQSNYLENYAGSDKAQKLGRKIGSVLYWSQHGSQWEHANTDHERVSTNTPYKPFKKFSDTHHRRSDAQGYREDVFRDFTFHSGRTRRVRVGSKWIETKPAVKGDGPPTLEERWDSESVEGGPNNKAKGGGSATTAIKAKLTSPRPYEGEQNGQLSIKFGEEDFFVPDSPFNRDLWEKFQTTYTSGQPDEDGHGFFHYFMQLADVVGTPSFGNATIRAHWENFFYHQGPMTPPKKIFRRNMWAQQDLKTQYDEGREYAFTDSYYRYDFDETPNLEFGDEDDPVTRSNHQSFTLSRPDDKTIELKRNIQRATVRNPEGQQWPNRDSNPTATFKRGEEYDQRMKRGIYNTFFTDTGQIWSRSGEQILVHTDAWPTLAGVSPNKTPFAQSRRARNLEELWFSLVSIKTDGPTSTAVERSGRDIRLSTFFSANRISTLDYKIRFLSSLNGTYTNVPSEFDAETQGTLGFNVGQVRPYADGVYKFGSGRDMDRYDEGMLKAIFGQIYEYEQELMEIRPGSNRIQINFNIRVNLNKLLQQNLLLPSDIHPTDTNPDGEYRRSKDLSVIMTDPNAPTHIDDDTFTKLYLENRATLQRDKGFSRDRSPDGTIAGVPVADLQGPVTYQTTVAGMYHTTNYDDDNPVFKFSEDKERHNTITQDRGFIDNIAGQVHENGEGIAGLMPAVVNDDAGSFPDKTTFLKTRGKADAQLFPFMFETVNKRGSARNGVEYKQYAYFQATLQSLNESYAPAWASKHFFGRTEQIHTYTMTERTIDLSFVIFATEIRRLQNLYERVSWLAQQTYPSYDQSNRLKSGPLIKMTIGDMFSGLNGFIRSLSFDWNHLGAGGKWEITQGLRIPMSCTVTMNFTVMHDAMPDRNFALYPGPIRGNNGLIGERGKTNRRPGGGPLIATAAGGRHIVDPADIEYLRTQMSPLEFQTLQADLEIAANKKDHRHTEYIEWTQANKWSGSLVMDQAVNEQDLVFD